MTGSRGYVATVDRFIDEEGAVANGRVGSLHGTPVNATELIKRRKPIPFPGLVDLRVCDGGGHELMDADVSDDVIAQICARHGTTPRLARWVLRSRVLATRRWFLIWNMFTAVSLEWLCAQVLAFMVWAIPPAAAGWPDGWSRLGGAMVSERLGAGHTCGNSADHVSGFPQLGEWVETRSTRCGVRTSTFTCDFLHIADGGRIAKDAYADIVIMNRNLETTDAYVEGVRQESAWKP
jgi:N-acetylglucosamine-6-phosphate deacetylase